MARDTVLPWLLEGDPAVRWQTLCDLKEAGDNRRQRIAKEGWGARLLDLQDPDGQWSRGIYTPKWTSTTYTMVLLRSLALEPGHPGPLRASKVLLDKGFWPDGGINFFAPRYQRSETCVTSMILGVLCWFRFEDPRVDRLAAHVIEHQMPDGGWNCRADATHGSFHTTISALEALLDYERFRPASGATAREAQARGREFLLVHRMFRSHRTGAVVKPEMTLFHFPARWHYDVLRGLDYFRDAGAPRDPRLEDAIALVEKRRQPDGRWLLTSPYPGATFFDLERTGEPSRWNTLRALRVLRWWNQE